MQQHRPREFQMQMLMLLGRCEQAIERAGERKYRNRRTLCSAYLEKSAYYGLRIGANADRGRWRIENIFKISRACLVLAEKADKMQG